MFCFFKMTCISNKKTPAASLQRSKHELGLPIHIKALLILLNIEYQELVLNKLLSWSIISNFLLEYVVFRKKYVISLWCLGRVREDEEEAKTRFL